MEEQNFYTTSVLRTEEIKKAEEKRAVKRVAAAVGIAFSAMLILPAILSALMADSMALLGLSNKLATLISNPIFLKGLNVVFSVIAFIIPFAFLPRGVGSSISALMPFKRPEKGTLLPVVFMALGFCAFGNIAAERIAQLFSMVGIDFSTYVSPTPNGLFEISFALLATAVTPALVEEFAMRGAVGGALKPFGEGFMIITSSVIFGFMHCNFVQIPFAFIVGLALGFALVKTKTLWAPILIHFINNAVSVLLDAFLSGSDLLYLRSVVYTLYFVVCFVLFFIGLLLASKKQDFFKLEKSALSLTVGEIAKTFFLSPFMIIAFLIAIFESLATVSLSFI